MHALIVVSHPDSSSLTHGIARRIAEGISDASAANTVELVDLADSGFDPRFTAADIAVHRKEGPFPADVAAEQARIDRADALIIVYPVYWWSMPALLKGWIDRVFSNGWAFDFSAEATLIKKLTDLEVHLVGIGGADAGTYERHGYASAMKTQIDHGIFDYCGARVITSGLMLDSETQEPAVHLNAAYKKGSVIFPRERQARPDAVITL